MLAESLSSDAIEQKLHGGGDGVELTCCRWPIGGVCARSGYNMTLTPVEKPTI